MNSRSNGYVLSDFIPLLAIISLISLATLAKYLFYGADLYGSMSDFMGFFFLVFGSFKLINWPGFVSAYRMYDLLAQKSTLYAYLYPLIEVALGIAYLTRWQPLITYAITVVVMFVSSLGVINALRQKQKIVCACLGAVFKLPMTYVTLAEDLLMLFMALIMLAREII